MPPCRPRQNPQAKNDAELSAALPGTFNCGFWVEGRQRYSCGDIFGGIFEKSVLKTAQPCGLQRFVRFPFSSQSLSPDFRRRGRVGAALAGGGQGNVLQRLE
jgi:hypothetical protein